MLVDELCPCDSPLLHEALTTLKMLRAEGESTLSVALRALRLSNETGSEGDRIGVYPSLTQRNTALIIYVRDGNFLSCEIGRFRDPATETTYLVSIGPDGTRLEPKEDSIEGFASFISSLVGL